jgi:photosystem II stability/assembly factor-like uncharacterized protein
MVTIQGARVSTVVVVVLFLFINSFAMWINQSPSFASSQKASAIAATTMSLESFDFSNPTSGLGVFAEESPSGDRCADFVGQSKDGGSEFNSLVRVTSWNCSSKEFSSTITSDGHGDVFLYGPQLFISHDNAKTWSRDPQSGSVLAVDAVGLSVWMVKSICTRAEVTTTAPCPVRLIESKNGGRTWETSRSGPSSAKTGFLEGALGQSFLTRTSRSTAYLMLAPHFHLDGDPSVAPLWITTNGGDTWLNRQVPCHMGAMSSVFSVAPDGTMMTVCASEPSAGNQPKTVLESTDGGTTWILKTRSDIDGGYLGSIDLLSNEQAFLVGDRSSLLETRDGGSHWKAVQPVIGSTAGGTSQVRFFNDSDGLVLGNDDSDNERLTLWSTVDGGDNWKVVVPHPFR